MSTDPFAAGLDMVRRHWGWYLVLGILLIVVGLFAIVYAGLTTIVSLVLFGWLLVVTGVAQFVQAFRVRDWGGFFLHLLAGVIELVVGILVVTHPVEAAAGVTLALALYLLVGGVFRAVAAVALRFPLWGLVAASGLVSFLLGLAVWRHWPWDSLWFIGLCVGIDLMLHGLAWVAIALAARKLPASSPPGSLGTPAV